MGFGGFGASFALAARRSPERVAVQTLDGTGRTYAEVDDRTTRLANALIGCGLQPGDRVAAWLSTSPEYLELYLAVAKAALVMVPINDRFTTAEAAYQLEHSGARALFFSPCLEERVAALPLDVRVRTVVGKGSGPAPDYETLIAEGSALPGRGPGPAPGEDDVFVIAYTSGTTGHPKGVMVTHRHVHNVARATAGACRYPIYGTHAFGASMSFVATVIAQMLPHLFLGGRILFCGGWDPERIVYAIDTQRATYTYIPTPGLRDFATCVERRPGRCRSLVSALHAGSPAHPDVLEAVVAALGPRFIEGWGMTENSGCLLTATSASDFSPSNLRARVLESVGRPIAGAVIDVFADDGTPLPHDGSPGMLVARSSTMMRGYWRNPSATADCFRDGWYTTGDVGSIDADGYVYLADRRLDLILSGGANIYPSELERVLLMYPGVREAAVVAAPDEQWGQTPVAFVVAAPDSALTESAVIAHCRAHLASYKKPTRVVFVDGLPRNTSDKVLRTVLREWAAADAVPSQTLSDAVVHASRDSPTPTGSRIWLGDEAPGK